MSHELKTAAETALADCCSTFGSSAADAVAAEEAAKEAINEAITSSDNFFAFTENFSAALEAKLRLIPNIAVTLDAAALMKIVTDLWDKYIEPRSFPFKAIARPAFLWAAQLVINRILAV